MQCVESRSRVTDGRLLFAAQLEVNKHLGEQARTQEGAAAFSPNRQIGEFEFDKIQYF